MVVCLYVALQCAGNSSRLGKAPAEPCDLELRKKWAKKMNE